MPRVAMRAHASALNHWQDSQETFGGSPATPRTPKPGVKHVTLGDGVAEHELYRIRTHPELYDEWQVELVMDQCNQRWRATGLLHHDCHHCKRTVLIDEVATRCTCGWGIE